MHRSAHVAWGRLLNARAVVHHRSGWWIFCSGGFLRCFRYICRRRSVDSKRRRINNRSLPGTVSGKRDRVITNVVVVIVRQRKVCSEHCTKCVWIIRVAFLVAIAAIGTRIALVLTLCVIVSTEAGWIGNVVLAEASTIVLHVATVGSADTTRVAVTDTNGATTGGVSESGGGGGGGGGDILVWHTSFTGHHHVLIIGIITQRVFASVITTVCGSIKDDSTVVTFVVTESTQNLTRDHYLTSARGGRWSIHSHRRPHKGGTLVNNWHPGST